MEGHFLAKFSEQMIVVDTGGVFAIALGNDVDSTFELVD